ncbi:putative mediator of RNA polymerase II transcription subunit 26 [Microplitis mediator]|uniref:putative mediator of RNA polymerase II transcription subunit 26 n=1 Tax=Microplitis mediator TaxID=375433 RepID=UPI0025529D66|nr:putative mediator of RNA polymerase II transcription subunit 26 [Microplitis mediator]
MVRVCTVKSCPSGRKSKKVVKETLCSVSFFQAKTPVRLQHWSKSLGVALKASDYICQFHFKAKDINMYAKIVIGNEVHLHSLGRKDFTEEAVPTIEHQLQLNPELQQQDQQQLEQEQHQPDQEQQQSEQEQLQSEQQQLEQEQQQPEQIPEIVKPISYLRKKYALLPQNWSYAEKPDAMEFIRIDPVRMQIQNHIALNKDFSISVIFTNFERVNLNDKLSSPDEIFDYLKSVEKWPLCVGTQIEKQRYSSQCKRVVIGDEAYQRNQINPRCKSCRVLRRRLQSKHSYQAM